MSKKTFRADLTEIYRREGALTEYQDIHMDMRTGIVWIEDGSTGMGHTCHPNIDDSGSIRGMKERGYWGKDDVIVRSHGYYYNISRTVATDPLDEIVLRLCHCPGVHAGRNE